MSFTRDASTKRSTRRQRRRTTSDGEGRQEKKLGQRLACTHFHERFLSGLMLKDRIAELKAIRDQARADAERADRTPGAGHNTEIDQGVCQDGPQADADRGRQLSPRLSPRARPARRSRRERTSHHGLEKRTAEYARRRFKRENGGFWRAQFCIEVARPTRFERELCLRSGAALKVLFLIPAVRCPAAQRHARRITTRMKRLADMIFQSSSGLRS